MTQISHHQGTCLLCERFHFSCTEMARAASIQCSEGRFDHITSTRSGGRLRHTSSWRTYRSLHLWKWLQSCSTRFCWQQDFVKLGINNWHALHHFKVDDLFGCKKQPLLHCIVTFIRVRGWSCVTLGLVCPTNTNHHVIHLSQPSNP